MIRVLRLKTGPWVGALALLGWIGVTPAQAFILGGDDGDIYALGYVGAVFEGESEETISGATFALDRDINVLGGGAVGYAVPVLPLISVRGEIDGSFTSVDVEAGSSVFDTTDANLFAALANLWVDLHTPFGFTPYAGGGIGIGVLNFDGSNNTDTGLAYQVGGGILAEVPVTPFFIGLNYRYFVYESEVDEGSIASLTSPVDLQLDGHRGTVSVGVKF